MAVIQPVKTHANGDTCAVISWSNLMLRTGGLATCPGSSPLLTWSGAVHGLVAANVGTSMYLTPTGGTAGVYALASVTSATGATFNLVGGNAAVVAGVACTLGDVGAPYSQPDAALDRTLQVHGTFGASGSLSYYGSNDNINFAPSKDNTGAALNCTTTTVRNVFDGPLYATPMITTGDATTNLNAIVVLRIQLPRAIQ